MDCLSSLCTNCGRVEEGVLSGKKMKLTTRGPTTLSSEFETLVRKQLVSPNKTAVEFMDHTILTYSQLDEISSVLAVSIKESLENGFKTQNPDGDVIIAVSLPASEKAIAVILAILKLGVAYLPLDYEHPETLLLDIIKAFRPVLLISCQNGSIFNKFNTYKFLDQVVLTTVEELWSYLDLPLEGKPRGSKGTLPDICPLNPHPHLPPAEQIVVIVQAAGLNDNIHGTRLTNKSLLTRIFTERKYLNVKSSNKFGVFYNLSSIEAVVQTFRTLLVGATLLVFRKQELWDMDTFLKSTSRLRLKRISMGHDQLGHLLYAIDSYGVRKAKKSLKHLKLLICQGHTLSRTMVEKIFSIFRRSLTVVNCVGLSETSGYYVYEKFSSVRDFDRKCFYGRLTHGHIVDNTKVYILGSSLDSMADGHQGEICVTGACLCSGYVNRSSKYNSETFLKNPYTNEKDYETFFRSGEYGRIVRARDGVRRLLLEGRSDRLVRAMGYKFFISDIKICIENLPCVKKAFVFEFSETFISDQSIIACVVLNDGSIKSNMEPDIERDLKHKMPEWAIPHYIFVLDNVPGHSGFRTYCMLCLKEWVQEKIQTRFDSWEDLKLRPDKLEAGMTLMLAIFKYCHIPVSIVTKNLVSKIWDLGAEPKHVLPMLLYLIKRSYYISIKDILYAQSLNDIISTMVLKYKKKSLIDEDLLNLASGDKNNQKSSKFNERNTRVKYRIELISKKHKDEAIKMLCNSYLEHGPLQKANMCSMNELTMFFYNTWMIFEEEELSFVLYRVKDESLIGIALNADFFTILNFSNADGPMLSFLEFMNEVKGEVMHLIPPVPGDTLQSYCVDCHSKLDPVETVEVKTLLHEEVIYLGRQCDFSRLFMSPTDPFSRTLIVDVLGFTLLNDFPANEYKDMDGFRPFHLASDFVTMAACLLKLATPSTATQGSLAGLNDDGTSSKVAFHRAVSLVQRGSFFVK